MSYYGMGGAEGEFAPYAPYPEKPLFRNGWIIASALFFAVGIIFFVISRTLLENKQETFTFTSTKVSAQAAPPSTLTTNKTSKPPTKESAAMAPVAEKASKDFSQLQEKLVTWTDEQEGKWGFYVASLDDDAATGHNEKQQFRMASIYKLFMLKPLLAQIPSGSWDNQKINDKTYQECVTAMLAVSDNPCGLAIGERLGWSVMQDQIASEYEGTIINDIERFFSTPYDTGLLLERLYEGDGYDDKARRIALEALSRPKGTEAVRKACEGCEVYNKTGDLRGVKHDAALVKKDGKTYVVVIFSDKASWPKLVEAAGIITAEL